jgi:hypothetical protein
MVVNLNKNVTKGKVLVTGRMEKNHTVRNFAIYLLPSFFTKY